MECRTAMAGRLGTSMCLDCTCLYHSFEQCCTLGYPRVTPVAFEGATRVPSLRFSFQDEGLVDDKVKEDASLL